jgi:hypothetical protein
MIRSINPAQKNQMERIDVRDFSEVLFHQMTGRSVMRAKALEILKAKNVNVAKGLASCM